MIGQRYACALLQLLGLPGPHHPVLLLLQPSLGDQVDIRQLPSPRSRSCLERKPDDRNCWQLPQSRAAARASPLGYRLGNPLLLKLQQQLQCLRPRFTDSLPKCLTPRCQAHRTWGSTVSSSSIQLIAISGSCPLNLSMSHLSTPPSPHCAAGRCAANAAIAKLSWVRTAGCPLPNFIRRVSKLSRS